MTMIGTLAHAGDGAPNRGIRRLMATMRALPWACVPAGCPAGRHRCPANEVKLITDQDDRRMKDAYVGVR
jgi:hypothetical protein